MRDGGGRARGGLAKRRLGQKEEAERGGKKAEETAASTTMTTAQKGTKKRRRERERLSEARRSVTIACRLERQTYSPWPSRVQSLQKVTARMSREMSTLSRSLPPDQTTILLLVQIYTRIYPPRRRSVLRRFSTRLIEAASWSLRWIIRRGSSQKNLRRFAGDRIDSFSHDMDLRGAYAGSNSLDYVNYANMYAILHL